jgi:hypothetical protein
MQTLPSWTAWQHRRWESIGEAPRLGRVVVARFQYDRGTASASALEVQPATTADADQAGEVILRGDRDRWGNAIAAEDDDGAEEDSDREDCEAMAKPSGNIHASCPWQIH